VGEKRLNSTVAFLWPALGVALVAAVVWEVFDDLFRPGATSALSDWLGRAFFDAFRRVPHLLGLAGPLSLVTLIGLWCAGLVIGFALIFVPVYPAAFQTGTGAVPPDSRAFLSALNFSFETLTTLGYGDIVPRSWIVRFVASLEGLVGFGLVTASVSSIVLIYPALSRMRLLARGVAHIVDAEQKSGTPLADLDSELTLSSLARDVTHVRIDLIHFPIVYYFASQDVSARVARWVHDLARFASDASQPGRPERVRFAAIALDSALDDFAGIVDRRFLHTNARDRRSIFDALAKDQLTDQRPS
jgi:hypothetical protein